MKTTCPYCKSPEVPEQPQPSLHAYSTVYTCGYQVVQAFGGDEQQVEHICNTTGKPKGAPTQTLTELIDSLMANRNKRINPWKIKEN